MAVAHHPCLDRSHWRPQRFDRSHLTQEFRFETLHEREDRLVEEIQKSGAPIGETVGSVCWGKTSRTGRIR